MGMLFGGWAREDAEEELYYIKKYGLEAGQVAYQDSLRRQEEQRKYNQEHPTPIVYSKTEPYVTNGDVITDDYRYGIQFHVTKITDEGEIMGRRITPDPMSDPHMGGEYKWDGPYKMITANVGEFDSLICGPQRPAIK